MGALKSRSLQWERGLKYLNLLGLYRILESFPAMGTWIEMSRAYQITGERYCRSLQWERGLKCVSVRIPTYIYRRSLQWERGLKYEHPSKSRWHISRSLQWERGLKSFHSFEL